MKTIWWIIVGYFNLLMAQLRMLSKKRRKLYSDRYDVCKTCIYLEKDIWEYCKICGCYVKAKTKVDKANCPQGYW